MARGTEGRLQRLERTIGDQGRGGWASIDVASIADRVCRDHGITTEQLERELERSTEEESDYPNAIVESYYTAFGQAMRRAGLDFVDLIRLADQEVSA